MSSVQGFPLVQTIRANYTAANTNVLVVPVRPGATLNVTSVAATCDKANTVDVQVRIGFGTTTTPTTAGVVLSHPGIAAGSGEVVGSGAGIIGSGAEGQGLLITSEEPTTGSMDVVVSYFWTGPGAY